MTPRLTDADLERMVEQGPPDMTRCDMCGTKTRSHYVVFTDEGAFALTGKDLLKGRDIVLSVFCHTCHVSTDFPLDTDDKEYQELAQNIREQLEDGDMEFTGFTST